FNFLSSVGIETERYENIANSIFRFFSENLVKNSISYPSMLSAYYYTKSSPKQIIVLAEKENKEAQEILNFLEKEYIPNSILLYVEKENLSEAEKVLPILKGKNSDKEVAVFICKNQTCDLPIYSLEAVKKAIGVFTTDKHG
ncbi:MAG TPA: hypothetical protein PLS71_15455, partial [Leptospiraceae bacterium]|nr:hypothetical protein [Leptospiraceae bacterium]